MREAYVMPTGWAPVSVAADAAEWHPWLEVQFMTAGAPMLMPQRAQR